MKTTPLPAATCRLDIDCSTDVGIGRIILTHDGGSVFVKQEFDYGDLSKSDGPKSMGEFEMSPMEARELSAALRIFANMMDER